MGKLKSVERQQRSGRSFTNASVTQPEQVFSHYAAADCVRARPTCTNHGRGGISAITELNSTKSREERKGAGREPCTRSARPALAHWAGTLMPDFTRLLKGKRVLLLEPGTELH